MSILNYTGIVVPGDNRQGAVFLQTARIVKEECPPCDHGGDSAATQQFPTSGSAIYDALSSDTAFTNLLGTYSFKGNTGPLTALSVVSPGQDLPSLRRVSGVECIIQDVGASVPQNYLTDAPYIITTFSVFCILWEPGNGSDLQEVVNHLLRRFVGSSSVETVATPDGLGSLVQSKVMIKSNMPIYPS